MAGPFFLSAGHPGAARKHPERFHDSHARAMKDLIEERAMGKRIVARPSHAAPDGKIVDPLHALRKSLNTGGEGAAAAQKPRKRGRAPQKKAS